MTHQKLTSRITTALLALTVAIGGVGCLVTAFQISEANMLTVGICAALWSVVYAVILRYRLSVLPLLALVLGSILLWLQGTLEDSVELLLYRITMYYDMGYGSGYIQWSETLPTHASMTPALCLIGMVSASAVVGSVFSGRHIWPAMILGFFPLAVCLGLTDTVPSTGYLFLLLLGLILLLLTQLVRRQDPRQGNRLVWILSAPVALALCLLLLAYPQYDYTGQNSATALQETFLSWLENFFTLDLGSGQSTDSDSIDLENAGPQGLQNQIVMYVTSEHDALLYLRGRAYNVYNGTSWTGSAGKWSYEVWDTSRTDMSNTVWIRTVRSHSVMYVPYVPYGESLLSSMISGYVPNTDDLTEYIIEQVPAATYEDWWENTNANIFNSGFQYLQLPQTTRTAARDLLMRKMDIGWITTADQWRVANQIAEFVQRSASYDLQTGQMPAGTTDFALWFLEESDTGYCTHFATAATVLLRAVGIPARYVTGYLVDASAGETVAVRTRNAHAWVEYYIDGAGWIVLEPTPSGGGSPIPPETTTPTPTEPSQDTSPSEITEPSENTQPSESTAPTETTEPTLPTDIQKPAPPTEESDPWILLGTVLIICCAIGAVPLQWQLRLRLRRKKQFTGPTNQQALARWKECCFLSRLLQAKPDAHLRKLAEKAKFSQHTITDEELALFADAMRHAQAELRKAPPVKQFYYRIIRAAY